MKPKTVHPISLQPRLRVVSGQEIALGPGKVELLALVEKTGSITEAAKRMQMSYMRAWMLIRTMNQCFKQPLVITIRGGSKGGGGAVLSETGREALELYHQMNRQSLKAMQPSWKRLQNYLRR